MKGMLIRINQRNDIEKCCTILSHIDLSPTSEKKCRSAVHIWIGAKFENTMHVFSVFLP